jgi:molecular chaperone DnaK
VHKNKVMVLKRPDGSKSVPSVVGFPAMGRVVVGDPARAMLATDPRHVVGSPKRLLGRRYDDKDVEPYLGQAAYEHRAAPGGAIAVEMWGEEYTLPQLCSFILKDALAQASALLEERVERAVLTVPVSFDEVRIAALHAAADLVGLEVVATVDEPTAAALANRFLPGFGGVVGVYDFGGGTFDFSVVDVTKGDFQVLGTAGDTWLGGDDFDLALADAAANHIWQIHKVDLRRQQVEWQKLLFACETAKRELSTQPQAVITVPEAIRTAAGLIDVTIPIDRAAFERVCEPVIERSLATCSEALELLDLTPQQLSAVYLSGGTTHIPAVRHGLVSRFGVPVLMGVAAEHAVVLGAGVHAAQVSAGQVSVGLATPTSG